MLYLAFPRDMRSHFEEDSEWLVYDTMITDTDFHAGDVLVVAHWMFTESAQLIDALSHVREQGARVIYIGTAGMETEVWRKQLVMAGVYDVMFVDNEIDLNQLKELIHASSGAAAHADAFQDIDAQIPNEGPDVVEYQVDTPSEKVERVASRITVQTETVPVILPSRLIAVVSAWPRAGATFVSMGIAQLLAQGINQGQVQLVEYPPDSPYYWTYFGYQDEDASEYQHWSVDGKGTPYTLEGVSIHPAPPQQSRQHTDRKLTSFLFRQLRSSFVIVDLGVAAVDDAVLEHADDILFVMEAEPARLDNPQNVERYNDFKEQYANLQVVMNKTTKFVSHFKMPDVSDDGERIKSVKLKELFPNAVFIPYVDPEYIQEAAWTSVLPVSIAGVAEQVDSLRTDLVNQWIPKELQKGTKRKLWRRKGRAGK